MPYPAGSIVAYYVEAKTTGGVASYLPRTAEFQGPSYEVSWPRGSSPIVINEFMASNSTTIADEKGQFDDWLELTNTSNVAVNIGGHYLTDDTTNPTKYQIPANTMVPANGTVLVWCDEDGTQGPLHANFKLSASGEDILFFATDGKTLYDTVKFGQQYSDVSTGRLYDGQGPWWVTFPAGSASPDAANQPSQGHRTYSALDAAEHPTLLKGSGDPKIAGQLTWTFSAGPANSAFVTLVGGSGVNLPIPALELSLLVGTPYLFIVAVPSDSQGGGTFQLPIPDDSNLVGLRLYGQGFSPAGAAWQASTAVETTLQAK